MKSCLGGSLRIELRAESRFVGCLSTIIVFMLASASTTATSSVGHGHVIRRVKVYFEDPQMAELRPVAPFKRPPRVSGKHATVQIEGLPLEKSVNHLVMCVLVLASCIVMLMITTRHLYIAEKNLLTAMDF